MNRVPRILAFLALVLASCTQPLPDQDWEFNLGLEVSFTTSPNGSPEPGPILDRGNE